MLSEILQYTKYEEPSFQGVEGMQAGPAETRIAQILDHPQYLHKFLWLCTAYLIKFVWSCTAILIIYNISFKLIQIGEIVFQYDKSATEMQLFQKLTQDSLSNEWVEKSNNFHYLKGAFERT